ncbi:TcpQ domain-containing protein [Cupriavidus campinensis]|nr:TcpQ domain-containing protein [Cupriavidus campinensis]
MTRYLTAASPRLVPGAIALAIAALLSAGEAHSASGVDLVAARSTSLAAAKAAEEAGEKQRAKEGNPSGAMTAAVATSLPVAKAEPPKPVEIWRITAEDGTLADGLRKWVLKAGYEGLEWSAGREIRAYRLEQTGTFKEALWQVMYDTGTTNYRLRACIYKNGLVRIVTKNTLCKFQ